MSTGMGLGGRSADIRKPKNYYGTCPSLPLPPLLPPGFRPVLPLRTPLGPVGALRDGVGDGSSFGPGIFE